MAFKSDVDFWRRNKSLRGLSVRTLFMEVFFQTIILLSLIEEEASLLVTVPSGVGVLIQVSAGVAWGWMTHDKCTVRKKQTDRGRGRHEK